MIPNLESQLRSINDTVETEMEEFHNQLMDEYVRHIPTRYMEYILKRTLITERKIDLLLRNVK